MSSSTSSGGGMMAGFADSRPSEGNCAGAEDGGKSVSNGGFDVGQLERVVESLDDDLARKAVSVTPDRKLRRECVREIRGSAGSFKAKTTRGVLVAFLKWAGEQLNSELVFESGEGDTVKAPVPVSISEEKAKEYYARLKDMERALLDRGVDPHTAMLTLTGSTQDANGNPRCVVDHMADVQESWNPHVRRELQRTMDAAGFGRFDPTIDYELANGIAFVLDDEPGAAKWWEYVTVLEPHNSGYAHFHVGVFTSHEIAPEMFESVMSKHVEECLIAGSDAHRVHGPDSAVSVNEVDPSQSQEGREVAEGMAWLNDEEPDGYAVSNLGSYLSEYIGSFSDGEFLDRPVHELVFYAACWSANRQRVRFSNGANRLAAVGQRLRNSAPSVSSKEWTLTEIERPNGETHPPHTGGGVEMVRITGAGSVDPRPMRR